MEPADQNSVACKERRDMLVLSQRRSYVTHLRIQQGAREETEEETILKRIELVYLGL
jgi:hypothetical protein